MPTSLKSTKKLRFDITVSTHPKEKVAKESSSSQLKSGTQKILNRWKIWEAAVKICFLEGRHGEGCSRLVCPCQGKYTSPDSVRLSFEVGVHRLLAAGVSMEQISKHNLDSPMMLEKERNEWIEIFADRVKLNKRKGVSK